MRYKIRVFVGVLKETFWQPTMSVIEWVAGVRAMSHITKTLVRNKSVMKGYSIYLIICES